MRPFVEREPSARVRPIAVARWAALLLASAPLARAGDGDGPELSPPANMPAATPAPRPKPVAPAPISAVPATPPRRAVMAVPGLMTTPRPPIVSTPSTAPIPDPLPSTSPGPTLDGPLEMPAPSPSSRARRPTSALDRGPIIEDPDVEPLPPRSSRVEAAASIPSPSPSPARRGRLFGLFPSASRAVGPSATPPPGRAVVEADRAEPTPESALKLRIERQARAVVGDRARLIEVRVEGKSATVQARGVRVFQKRAVRKALESLPALSGLRSTIEVSD